MLLSMQDWKGRTAFSLAYQHDSLIIVLDKLISDKAWVGDPFLAAAVPRGSFMQSSSFWALKQYPEQILLPAGSLPQLNNKGVHPFQFNVFRHSLFFKYYFHLLITLICTLIAHNSLRTIGYEFLDFFQGFLTIVNEGASEAELETYAQGIYSIEEKLKDFAYIYLTLLFSLSFFLFTDLQLCCMRKSPRSLGLVHFLLGLCFCVTIYGWIDQIMLLKEFQVQQPTALAKMMYIQPIVQSDSFKLISRLIGLTFLSFYSYILFSFRIFSYFSKLTVIITSILAKVFPFLLLQGALIYIFTSYISFSLNEMPVYATESSTYSLLIQAYFGNIDFQRMIDHSIFYSKIAITFFLIVNYLVMLNLLIAVMLEDYTKLSTTSRTLYLRWLIDIHPLWKGDPANGFLSYKYGPLSFINLILSPFITLSKSKRCNMCMEMFLYLIPLILMGTAFFIIDIVYFFLCVWLLLTKTYKLRRETKQSSFSKEFANKKQRRLALSLICSCPCKITSNLCNFFNEAFNSKKLGAMPCAPPTLSNEEARYLLQILHPLVKSINQATPLNHNGRYIILARDIVRYIRTELNLEFNFLSLFHSTQRNNLSPFQLTAFKKFEKFEHLKKFIWNNSFESDGQLVTDPACLYYSLEQLVIESTTYSSEGKKMNRLTPRYSVTPATTESMMSIDHIIQNEQNEVIEEGVKNAQFMICGPVGKALVKNWRVFPLKNRDNHSETDVNRNFWDEAWKRSLN